MKHSKKWKSILQSDREYCYLCDKVGTYNSNYLQKHHIFDGPNRKHSEKEGLYVTLCIAHHTEGAEAVHNNYKNSLLLMKDAQEAYEKRHTRKEFMSVFGKNYL